ncbi:TPA: hypothetical protein N0F65_001008, partial [Lagenidium giganteum]
AKAQSMLAKTMRLDEQTIPALEHIQNVMYYRQTKADGSEWHHQIAENLPETRDGQIVFSDGSDEEPFVAGFSTPYLIRRLDRDPASFCLPFDSTYKSNKVKQKLKPLNAVRRRNLRFFMLFHLLENVKKKLQHNLGLKASELTTFATYFIELWAFSKVWRWRCYHTRSGMAVTKNPVETYRLIKDVVTLRRKLCPETLMVEALNFAHLASPEHLIKAKSNSGYLDTPLLLGGFESEEVSVKVLPLCDDQQQYDLVNEDEIERLHDLRDELLKPSSGCVVSTRDRVCECLDCYKFEFCVRCMLRRTFAFNILVGNLSRERW